MNYHKYVPTYSWEKYNRKIWLLFLLFEFYREVGRLVGCYNKMIRNAITYKEKADSTNSSDISHRTFLESMHPKKFHFFKLKRNLQANKVCNGTLEKWRNILWTDEL